MKAITYPTKSRETGEWRYNGKWFDNYPYDEVEADEAALDEYWDRERDR